MDLFSTILFCLCVAGGAVVQSVSGFGFGIFVMSLFPYFMPSYSMGLVLSGLLGMAITIWISVRNIRFMRWRLIVIPTVTNIVACALATRYLMGYSDAVLKLALGVVLIMLSLYFLFFSKRIHIRPTPLNGVIAGVLSGVISALFGMGGPPLVMYLLAATSDKDEYMANLSCIFLITSITTTITRALSGMLTPPAIRLIPLGVLFVVLGMVAGRRLFNKLSPDALRKAIYGFMAVSGAVMLVQAIGVL